MFGLLQCLVSRYCYVQIQAWHSSFHEHNFRILKCTSHLHNGVPSSRRVLSPVFPYIVAVLVLDPVVEVSVSDPDVSVEVSVKSSEVSAFAVWTPPAAATGSAKRTDCRVEL